MADDDTTGSTTADGQSSTEAAAADAADPAKVIEDLRKRQSGADKAREAAIAERDELKARIDALLSGKAGKQDDEKPDAASIRAQVEKEFEEKLATAQKAIEAASLDAKFPAARKRYPEVTDPAKLAELEVFFGETPAPPKPIGNNPAGSGATKSIDDMDLKELRASLDKQALSVLQNR